MSLASYRDDKVKTFPLVTPCLFFIEKNFSTFWCIFSTCLKSLRQLVSNISDVPSTSCWTFILAIVWPNVPNFSPRFLQCQAEVFWHIVHFSQSDMNCVQCLLIALLLNPVNPGPPAVVNADKLSSAIWKMLNALKTIIIIIFNGSRFVLITFPPASAVFELTSFRKPSTYPS